MELGPHIPSRTEDTNLQPAFEGATETLLFALATFLSFLIAPEPQDGNPHRHTWAHTHLTETQVDHAIL